MRPSFTLLKCGLSKSTLHGLVNIMCCKLMNEPHHEKAKLLNMQKQRGRSAAEYM